MNETSEQQIARHILECVDIFRKGCGNAGPMTAHLTGEHDPVVCDECSKHFVTAIGQVVTEDLLKKISALEMRYHGLVDGVEGNLIDLDGMGEYDDGSEYLEAYREGTDIRRHI